MGYLVLFLTASIWLVLTSLSYGSPTHERTRRDATAPSNIYDDYALLVPATLRLETEGMNLYEEFKKDRFNKPGGVLPHMKINGLPDASALTLKTRQDMTEQQLLVTHRKNLRAFMVALQKVVDDEVLSQPPKFVPDFQNLEAFGHDVLDRLEVVSSHLNAIHAELTETHAVFDILQRQYDRNRRSLFILGELQIYLQSFLQDVLRLQCTHAHALQQRSIPIEASPDSVDDNAVTAYGVLIQKSTRLYHNQNRLYEEYIEKRLGGVEFDPNINVDGLPNMSELTLVIRSRMKEEQLLAIHRKNLKIYDQALRYVITDEADIPTLPDFTEDLNEIRGLNRYVWGFIENVMEELHIPRDVLQQMPPLEQVPPSDQVTRQLRDFKILQSMNRYIPMIMTDFARLQNLHK